jgi:molecular chaperone IbpA
MQTFDFAPFTRSSIGFDRLFDLLETASRGDLVDSTYPPYNIEKLSDDA